MTPVLLTPPALEPLSLAEAKAWLRLDGTDEDAGLSALITAARMAIEARAHRLLITQGWRLIADAWPGDGVIRLPLAPVAAVTEIRVLDATGAATIVPASSFRIEATRDPARITLTAPVPQPGRSTGGIEIDITCGFGASATAVPEPLRHAIRLLVARWFERRGDEGYDGRVLPPDIALLLGPYHAARLT